MARKSKKQPRQIVHPRCAGIDIGSREHWVAVDPDRSARCLRLPLSYAPPRRCPPATSSACGPATTPSSPKPKLAILPVPAILAPAGKSNNPRPATSFGDCASTAMRSCASSPTCAFPSTTTRPNATCKGPNSSRKSPVVSAPKSAEIPLPSSAPTFRPAANSPTIFSTRSS